MLRCICLLVTVWLFCIAGSTTASHALMIPGTGDSQELLQELAWAFEAAHPGTVIGIPASIGSTGGIRQVLAGRAVLARVARPPRPEEQQPGLAYRVFARSPVVFAAHLEAACVQNLNRAELIGIHSGLIDNWAMLGDCPAQKIYVAHRQNGDSSRVIIETCLPEVGAINAPVGETLYSTPETLRILKRHAGTLAYLPLSALDSHGLTVLTFEGVAPTPEQVRSGRYPLVVDLGLVWREPLPPLAEQFRDFLFSPRAQDIIRQWGLVPNPPEH